MLTRSGFFSWLSLFCTGSRPENCPLVCVDMSADSQWHFPNSRPRAAFSTGRILSLLFVLFLPFFSQGLSYPNRNERKNQPPAVFALKDKDDLIFLRLLLWEQVYKVACIQCILFQIAMFTYTLIHDTVQIKELVKKNESFQICLRDTYYSINQGTNHSTLW